MSGGTQHRCTYKQLSILYIQDDSPRRLLRNPELSMRAGAKVAFGRRPTWTGIHRLSAGWPARAAGICQSLRGLGVTRGRRPANRTSEARVGGKSLSNDFGAPAVLPLTPKHIPNWLYPTYPAPITVSQASEIPLERVILSPSHL